MVHSSFIHGHVCIYEQHSAACVYFDSFKLKSSVSENRTLEKMWELLLSAGNPSAGFHHKMLYLTDGSNPQCAHFPVACGALYPPTIFYLHGQFLFSPVELNKTHFFWFFLPVSVGPQRYSRDKHVNSLLQEMFLPSWRMKTSTKNCTVG